MTVVTFPTPIEPQFAHTSALSLFTAGYCGSLHPSKAIKRDKVPSFCRSSRAIHQTIPGHHNNSSSPRHSRHRGQTNSATPASRRQIIIMDCQLQNTDVVHKNLGMDFRWHPKIYPKLTSYALDAANAGAQNTSSNQDEKTRFADAVSSFTYLDRCTHDYGILRGTMDPTTLPPALMDNPNMLSWQPTIQLPTQTHCQLSTQQSPLSSSSLEYGPRPITPGHLLSASKPTSMVTDGQPLSSQASTPASINSDSAISVSHGESEKTRRARYAANQRHSKAQKMRKDSHQNESTSEADTRADERRQRHRQKNKIAAAKCRLRQRKQVQKIQEKASRLGEKNENLKTMIRELRGELEGLRSIARNHHGCDRYIAQYNEHQAEKFVAEYQSSCLGSDFGEYDHLPEQQSFQAQ